MKYSSKCKNLEGHTSREVREGKNSTDTAWSSFHT